MKNMKKYIAVLFASSFLFLAGCDKQLDILPEQSVAESVVLVSDANVKKALNGAYDGLSSGSFLGGELQLFSELLAKDGEITWEGTYNQPREVANKAILVNNSFVSGNWLAGYNTINLANNILSAIDVVNEPDRNRVKGEALFLRGLSYFELVKLFAQPYAAGGNNPGMPLVLTPTRKVDEASYVPRSTVEQTYAQILADLTEAESLLPETNGNYAQKPAAAAMLSRVYLQMANYEGARDAANRAITYGRHRLVTPYAKAFNNGRLSATDAETLSPEDIFRIMVSSQDGVNYMHLYFSIGAYSAREGDVSVNAKHLDMYEENDARLDLFYQGAGTRVGSGPWRVGKWRYNYSNLPIVRLAEMYLTRAEANFRLGTTVGATPLEDVNRIRTNHAELPPLASVTLADILKERKLEIAFEGQGVHDLKRLKLSSDGFAWNDPKMVLPIPLREINASKGTLAQNAGY